MENKWPPLKECPQYRLGMLLPFLRKQPWEDREHVDDDEFYNLSDPNLRERRREMMKRERETVHNLFPMLKRFLHQVRTTRGYGIDCNPPTRFTAPFIRVEIENEDDREIHAEMVIKSKEAVIKYMNEKTGKSYEFVELLNLVQGSNRVYLLTFTARVIGSIGDVETFIAMVLMYFSEDGLCFKVAECLLKPEDDAPTDLGFEVAECRLKPEDDAPTEEEDDDEGEDDDEATDDDDTNEPSDLGGAPTAG